MSTWDAARIASRRPLHKPVSRIGHDPTISDLSPRQKSGASGGYSPSDKACQRCGYHVCSCPPRFNINAATFDDLQLAEAASKPFTLLTFEAITRGLLEMDKQGRP